jgi:hypothetical protein
MKDIDEGTIRRIDWQELVPPVLLFRVFTTAISVRMMFFALVGILLTIAAESIINQFESPSTRIFRKITEQSLAEGQGIPIPIKIDSTPNAGFLNSSDNFVVTFNSTKAVQSQAGVFSPWFSFTKSGNQFFTLDRKNWSERVSGFFSFAAMVIVWAFAGGLICRSAAMRLTNDKSESLGDLFRFMKGRGFGFVSSVLILTVGILFCAFIVSIPMFAWSWGWYVVNFVVALTFPFALLFVFFALLLLSVLWFGFPLLFAAVATDGADGFDAVSRAFSYLFQRPFHYLLYWILSAVQGFLGYFVIAFFVNGTFMITAHLMEPQFNYSITTTIITACFWLLRLLIVAYIFSWFWTSGVAIYLLLRRSVDAAPLTEIYRQQPVKVRVLPKIEIDPIPPKEQNTEASMGDRLHP